MPDLAHADSVQGNVIVTFDGRTLEKFSERTAEATRMIVGMLYLEVDGPDRKGRRTVKFSTQPHNRGGGFQLWVSDEQWPGVEPFVNEVAAAL